MLYKNALLEYFTNVDLNKCFKKMAQYFVKYLCKVDCRKFVFSRPVDNTAQ